MKTYSLTHEFVKSIPDNLKDNRLYVSVEYGSVIHKCCCGCGQKVVIPLSPTDWQIKFDGDTISLYPSIGNWNFPCRSHYWIIDNKVMWLEGKQQDQFTNEPEIGFFRRIIRKILHRKSK
ncbi:MAG: DUF6527 family protein [Victivallaceae bacterium]|jgi:hypothetical protein